MSFSKVVWMTSYVYKTQNRLGYFPDGETKMYTKKQWPINHTFCNELSNNLLFAQTIKYYWRIQNRNFMVDLNRGIYPFCLRLFLWSSLDSCLWSWESSLGLIYNTFQIVFQCCDQFNLIRFHNMFRQPTCMGFNQGA